MVRNNQLGKVGIGVFTRSVEGIGRVPVGEWVWAPLCNIADWIMEYPNGGAKRAIMIGVGLGMSATSLKLMLGLERAYLGKG